MKFSKEIVAGLVAIIAIVLLVVGINFLKGYSLFGGDNTYVAYFPNSGQLMVSSDVTLNGVVIGKVLEIHNMPKNKESRRVKIKFSISESNISLPKGTLVELGSLDLLKKGLIIIYPNSDKNGYLKPGDEVPGKMAVDMFSQVKQYADPISQKIQSLIIHIDDMVNSLSGVFDKNGASSITLGIQELRTTIKNIGSLSLDMKKFLADEKRELGRIMDHVENIAFNLKGTILEAQTTLKKLNFAIDDINQGKGTLGKLIKDEKLYNELVESNNELQELVDDLQANPQKYVHISVFGKKNKGLELTNQEEIKLKKLLDSIPE
ncbi:MAG: MCE family protein [Flavobacteriia bacterium]|nr:MCE family protein [Flavobacteriia bacterium]